MDWGDLRYLVALARAGSLSAAARALGAEHTTVARRVTALEAAVGARLFERGPRGYQLTAEGERVAEVAFRIEDDLFGLERALDAGHGAMTGVVRISAPPHFASSFIAPRLAPLRRAQPGVILELAGDSRAVSLSRREADIALRLNRPEQTSVIARRIGTMAYGLYGARSRGGQALAGERDYIGYDESLDHVPQQRWIAGLAGGRPMVFRTNDLASLAQAAAAGMGLAALPRFLGDADPRLERLPADARAAARELWLLVHPDLRQSPRVRLVLDFLAETIHAERHALNPEDQP